MNGIDDGKCDIFNVINGIKTDIMSASIAFSKILKTSKRKENLISTQSVFVSLPCNKI